MQTPYHGPQFGLDATDLLRFNTLKPSVPGRWTMTAASPRFEIFLLAAQILGGLGLGAAWLLSSSISGWPLVALALLIGGGLLAVAAFVALSGSFRVVPSPRAGATLVQAGIYRWLRHPMYVAVILVLAAAACSRPSIWVLLIVGLNCALYLGKARYEESVLIDHYEGYADYRQGTLGVKPLADSGARRHDAPTTDQEQSESPSGPSERE
jgi:protein-S-isoprenylcysteine O-methyltransferase Ste14